MTVRHLEVRPGIYRDSVQLMQLSSALAAHASVAQALVAMATGVNLEMLAQMGFESPSDAGPNDMLVALVTTEEAGVTSALALLEAELGGVSRRATADSPTEVAPRTTASAVAGSAASVVLVSTPGRSAFVETMDALDSGASVMVFSDNVPVAQEVRLKEVAAARGLLVMGPDCGTAVVGGVGLGFANVVRPGPVGLVAASGTGAQHLMSLLAGSVGISHCLGVGGRDLSAAVGAASTHAALDLLDADPATELIVLIGKPPAPSVASAVREHLSRLTTPAIFAPLGRDQPDLSAVAADVLGRLGIATPIWPSWPPNGTPAVGDGGCVRGLFSGGTLCVEAMAILSATLGPVRSNVPLDPEWRLDSWEGGHLLLDLGDDEYTVGRPHPMIDFAPRLSMLAREAADPECRVLFLDVVLGHGAHPDPAAELAPAVERALTARDTPLTVVVSLIGTPDDPQGMSRQAQALRDAGAWVFASNAEASRYVVSVARGSS